MTKNAVFACDHSIDYIRPAESFSEQEESDIDEATAQP